MPERRRVLGARHRDVHDPRRHLHAALRLLQRHDRASRPGTTRSSRPASRARSRRWACATPSSRASTATTCPTTAPRIWAATIRQCRAQAPECQVEVLTPDFRGEEMPLATVIAERPDVFNHNVEVVPRLYPLARRGSRWERSLRVLSNAKAMAGGEVVTKSGLMVGLGETHDEMVARLRRPARRRRPGADGRPVPAADRAAPAGRPLLAPGRVRRARGGRLRRSASTTSPPARSCARATTPISTCRSPSRASARSPRALSRNAGSPAAVQAPRDSLRRL